MAGIPTMGQWLHGVRTAMTVMMPHCISVQGTQTFDSGFTSLCLSNHESWHFTLSRINHALVCCVRRAPAVGGFPSRSKIAFAGSEKFQVPKKLLKGVSTWAICTRTGTLFCDHLAVCRPRPPPLQCPHKCTSLCCGHLLQSFELVAMNERPDP